MTTVELLNLLMGLVFVAIWAIAASVLVRANGRRHKDER
jgi:hypothetical protein